MDKVRSCPIRVSADRPPAVAQVVADPSATESVIRAIIASGGTLEAAAGSLVRTMDDRDLADGVIAIGMESGNGQSMVDALAIVASRGVKSAKAVSAALEAAGIPPSMMRYRSKPGDVRGLDCGHALEVEFEKSDEVLRVAQNKAREEALSLLWDVVEVAAFLDPDFRGLRVSAMKRRDGAIAPWYDFALLRKGDRPFGLASGAGLDTFGVSDETARRAAEAILAHHDNTHEMDSATWGMALWLMRDRIPPRDEFEYESGKAYRRSDMVGETCSFGVLWGPNAIGSEALT